MKTVALATLGCKVNQCESAYLEEKLCKGNFHIRPFTEEADLLSPAGQPCNRGSSSAGPPA